MESKYTWVSHRRRVRADILKCVHYRLVLNIAGFDLLTLSGTRELLYSTYDALKGENVSHGLRGFRYRNALLTLGCTALIDACTLGNRIHRDVHPGNIILYRGNNHKDTSNPRTGYLVDWDLSCTIDGLQNTKDVYRPSVSSTTQPEGAPQLNSYAVFATVPMAVRSCAPPRSKSDKASALDT